MSTELIDNHRSIGGVIPEELYWEFKAARAQRRETCPQALENAIRLYLDVAKEKKEKSDGTGQEQVT